MSIVIQDYQFEGPFASTHLLEDRAGVYVILTATGGGWYNVLDVGESENVRSRVQNHDRQACWMRNARAGGILYAALYMAGSTPDQRRVVERTIRDTCKPPCGEY